jgi:hypothetical protein
MLRTDTPTVEHHCPFQRSLVAKRHVRVLVGELQQRLADSPPISLGELGKLADDLCCAHTYNLLKPTRIVSRAILHSSFYLLHSLSGTLLADNDLRSVRDETRCECDPNGGIGIIEQKRRALSRIRRRD